MQPSPAQLLTPPPVACNMAETSLSRQVGGVGCSKNLAARPSRLTYRIRCRGSSGGPKLAIAAELSRSLDIRIRLYFEDKVDLFCTVVRYASDSLQLPHLEVDLATLTAESFWPTFAELHRLPLLRAFERPWLFAVISVAAQVSPSLMKRELLASLAHQIRTLVMRLIQRGQELGVICTERKCRPRNILSNH